MSAATLSNAGSSHFQSRKTKQLIVKIIITIVLVGLSIIILAPFWWMISTSLKSLKEIMKYPPTWIPEEVHWENYKYAWTKGNFGRYTLNTLFLAGVGVCSHVLSNSFIAYGFAKIKFKGRGFLFSLMLSTMMIPSFCTLIPQYILFSKMGWVGTYLPLTIPGFFGSAFQIFLLRQFYLGIPNDLIEAAKIDGASHFYVWRRIMIPLAKPAIIVIAITTFQGAWNDFLGPLLYVNKPEMFNLQLGLQSFKGTEAVQWHYLMAGSLMVLAPVILLFFLFQKYFIEGMNISSGTKG
ncbi:carbohydrate ABC transporter permease [Paenibacillus flagellatus]|uniref:Sugar ABC transporter ATP-binding protein n=1 Tax=Paenibacillus flagellatus TaxID=2211139 RepID=A0A2V5K2W4_9BACL|nr:carbohydrate ABC transporter permease [Paenibacillus flagellatus]PYI53521.1 sugar ABC transporter ATP-binding protein [Paenibacillus flagellatus]